MTDKDASELLHKLEKEFSALKMPFKVRPIEKVHLSSIDTYSSYSSYNASPFFWRMQIMTECNYEDSVIFYQMFKVDKIVDEPMVDFESMREFFVEKDDAFNFENSLVKTKQRYLISVEVELTEEYVSSFIEHFKSLTEPIKRRIYEQEFDKEVEDHLSEYNKDDGHK